MTELTSQIVIAAPAEQVWRVVAHQFDRIGDWATAIPSSAAHAIAPSALGAPVGARVCHTGLRLVPAVTETIVAYDESARTLTYEATDGMPSFVTRARNRWEVTAISPTQSQVAIRAELEVRGLFGVLGRWWLLARVARDGQHLLDDLRHYVEHGSPSPRKQRRRRPAAPPAGQGDDNILVL